MSLDAILYLVEMTWPFLTVVLIVGIIVGWRSYRPDRT